MRWSPEPTMRKSLLYTLLSLACWGAVIYCFTIVAPWTTAVSISDLDPGTRSSAGEHWRSAIVDHGKAKEWTRGTIGMNPTGFWSHASALCVFAIGAGFLSLRATKSHRAEHISGAISPG